jgi:Domain of unknown function (DUF2341)
MVYFFWTSNEKAAISRCKECLSHDRALCPEPLFPVLFHPVGPDGGFGGANEIFTKAQASGNDILFTAEDGVTKIPHEIENYSNGGTKDLTAWVQVPTFHHNVTTVVYMYYGNASVGSQQQKREVWDGAFASVYHLKENGAAGTFEDSTRNANAGVGGTATTNQSPTRSSDSIADYSEDFDGTDDFIKVPGRMGTPVNVTISAWVKLDSASANGSTVFSIGNSVVLCLDDSLATGHNPL